MPTKVELMKQLKDSQEESEENWMAAVTALKKLTALQIQYNRLMDLIKGCDSDEKLQWLKDLGYVKITIHQEDE